MFLFEVYDVLQSCGVHRTVFVYNYLSSLCLRGGVNIPLQSFSEPVCPVTADLFLGEELQKRENSTNNDNGT